MSKSVSIRQYARRLYKTLRTRDDLPYGLAFVDERVGIDGYDKVNGHDEGVRRHLAKRLQDAFALLDWTAVGCDEGDNRFVVEFLGESEEGCTDQRTAEEDTSSGASAM